MKNKVTILVVLCMLAGAWLALAQGSNSYASESEPASVTMVTLRIEGMT